MNKLELLANFTQQLRYRVKLKPKTYEVPDAWAIGIRLLARGYIELHEPLTIRDIDRIETKPIVVEHIGRLIKPRYHTYLEDIISFLQSEGLLTL